MIGPEWRAPLEELGPDLSAPEWADRIGCSPGEVRAACRLLGVSPRSSDAAAIAEYLTDYGAATIPQLVAELDLATSRASHALAQLERTGRVARLGLAQVGPVGGRRPILWAVT